MEVVHDCGQCGSFVVSKVQTSGSALSQTFNVIYITVWIDCRHKEL
jgi:hypothetical protein